MYLDKMTDRFMIIAFVREINESICGYKFPNVCDFQKQNFHSLKLYYADIIIEKNKTIFATD